MKIESLVHRKSVSDDRFSVGLVEVPAYGRQTLNRLFSGNKNVVIVTEEHYEALTLATDRVDTAAVDTAVDIEVEMTPFIEAGINAKILEAFEKCARSMETLKRSALSATKLRAYARQRYGPKTPEEIGAEMLDRLNDSNSVAEAMDIAAKYVREYGGASQCE